MPDQKKFLDAEGVKYLWSKLSLQDYPNNETLMDVIEAIDETKADKSEIIPSDWNQNDEIASDYIKNRPFGIIGEKVYEPITITWDGDTTDKVSFSLPPVMGATITFCKVSDLIPSLEQLQIGSSCIMYGENEEINFVEDADQGLITSTGYIFIATKDNAGNENLSFPEKGIYFATMTYNGMTVYVESLTISGGTVPIIQKIDTKYLPVDEIIAPVKEIAETAKETAETAKEIADAKMDKINPAGTGTFSLNANSKISLGTKSFTEGSGSASIGDCSHAEGYVSIAKGQGAHAEGYNYFGFVKVTGIANSTTYTVLEHNSYIRPGALVIYNDTIFSNITNYDQATLTVTLTSTLSAEEDLTEQSVLIYTGAFGTAAHAEGHNTIAYDHETHAEGYWTSAFGTAAHAEGYYTIANGLAQHAQGKYNIKDVNSGNKSYAHIVGNGTAEDARSNAHTLDWDGNAWFQGDVYVSSTSGIDKDEGSKKLATEDYVNDKIASIDVADTQVQPDWNQNDETAADYVKNRTHYSKLYFIDRTFEATSADGHTSYDLELVNLLWDNVDKATYTLKRAGREPEIYINPTIIELSPVIREIELANNYYVSINKETGKFFFGEPTGNGNFISGSIYLNAGEQIVQLDEKYIPTATDDEIVSMLAELDMLPAITDSDGAILTDENNNILLW